MFWNEFKVKSYLLLQKKRLQCWLFQHCMQFDCCVETLQYVLAFGRVALIIWATFFFTLSFEKNLKNRVRTKKAVEMHNMDDIETEEILTCLRITAHHPLHEIKNVFKLINFNKKEKHLAEDALKIGRDTKSCRIALYDQRVSRVQFSIRAFRHFNSSQLFFEIQNLSRRGKLIINNIELEYLNKVELPKKALVRFAEFQFLVEKEDGESTENFETFFELARAPCQEVLYVPSMSPVPETGLLINACSIPPYCSIQTPVEMEECELK